MQYIETATKEMMEKVQAELFHYNIKDIYITTKSGDVQVWAWRETNNRRRAGIITAAAKCLHAMGAVNCGDYVEIKVD